MMNCLVIRLAAPDKNSFNNSISDHQVGVTSLLRVHCVFFHKSLFSPSGNEGWVFAKMSLFCTV